MSDDRIFQNAEDGQWYFRVRRNEDRGPFTTESAARAALRNHVRVCQGHHSFSLRWPRTLNPARALRASGQAQPREAN